MDELLELPEGFFFRTIFDGNRVYIQLHKKTWYGLSSEKTNSVYTEEKPTEEVIKRCQQQALRTYYKDNEFELAAMKFVGDSETIIK